LSQKREKTYGVGILGAAHVHTSWYAREFRESSWAEVKAVVDSNLERAHVMLGEEKDHIPDYYTDPQEMLKRDDIDVVCIVSETSKHVELALAAAEAGKHICMEKVIALTLADADEVIRAVDQAGVKLICPPFAHDASPVLRKTKELIDEGRIGTPNLAHFHTGHEGLIYNRWEAWFYDPAQSGGGALVDLGVHPIYDSLYLFGEVEEVTGMMTTFYRERSLGGYHLANIRTDDNTITTIKFRNDMMCVSDVSFTRMADRSNTAIYGTEGTIILGDPSAPLLLAGATGSGEMKWQEPEIPDLKSPVELIVDLIEQEEGTWRVNGKWARDVLEVILATYESAKTKRTIVLPT